MLTDTSAFPRPDFVRQDWECLDGLWDFSFDTDSFDRQILVPFVYQSTKSGIGETQDHALVFYRRTFTVDPEKLPGRRLLLKFGAVDYLAQVFVNGTLVCTHEGGHVGFEADITDYVHPGENELKLRVHDGLEPDKPRGKQSWMGQCFGCWYTPTTGIWQSVWLEYAGGSYIRRIKVTPNTEENQALCEVFVSDCATAMVTVEAVVDSAKLGRTIPVGTQQVPCTNGYGKCVFTFPDMDITSSLYQWSPGTPNLVYLQATLTGTAGAPDTVTTYFGMRSAQFRDGKFFLNGHLTYQRLILDQGYWPDTLLTPPDAAAIQEDIRLTKEMGFNGVRKHQKIEDPRYYYWADRMGLLVWGELPSCYAYTDNTVRRSMTEMTDFVQRDFNHPCIVAWVPLNESWGLHSVRTNAQQQAFSNAMIFLIKALDPTRAVSGNDGWEQTTHTDIFAIHDYSLMPSTMHRYDDLDAIIHNTAESRSLLAEGQQFRNQPVIMTEYGGVSFENNGGWGYYNAAQSEEQLLGRIGPITDYLIKHPRFAGFCYTQLTDVMQEKNGLLDENRRPKVAPEKLRAIFAKRYFEE